MKRVVAVILILSLPMLVFSQYKTKTELPAMSDVVGKSSGLILGFLNSEKFSMHHSFSMGYMSSGKYGSMMVNSYMNTINYQISDPLFLRLNVGIMNSPYNSYQNPALNNTQFFGGAELFYRPSENSLIRLGVNVRPGFYRPGYFYDDYSW
jgi:hypothetical protein